METDGSPVPGPWEAIAGSSPEVSDNLEAAGHLAYRFEGQYLPVLLRSRTQEQQDRVWLAFWSYLTAPSNKRKPFSLSSKGADKLIEDFQKAMLEGNN